MTSEKQQAEALKPNLCGCGKAPRIQPNNDASLFIWEVCCSNHTDGRVHRFVAHGITRAEAVNAWNIAMPTRTPSAEVTALVEARDALATALPYIAGSYEDNLRIPRYKNDYEVAKKAVASLNAIIDGETK